MNNNNNEINNETIKNSVVTSILNSMIPYLDNEELGKLKNSLYINLHDITLTRNTYELATTLQSSDAMKIEYFISSKKIAGRADSTLQQYVRAVWNLRNYLNKNFEDITQSDIKYYLASEQRRKCWSNVYMRNVIQYLKVFFHFLKKEELILKDPTEAIEGIKVEKIIQKPFTPEELERIRNVCYNDVRNIALIEFLLATGVRVSELCSIKWKDIDINSNRIIVTGKGKKDRNVFFSDKAKFYLDNYFSYRMNMEGRTKEQLAERPLFVGKKRSSKTKDYEQITPDGIRSILNKIGETAGIEDIHPHKFRRTFATMALNRGMPLEEIKELLGHNDYNTTLKYARLVVNKVENSYKIHCDS